jgi:hypothetical protein
MLLRTSNRDQRRSVCLYCPSPPDDYRPGLLVTCRPGRERRDKTGMLLGMKESYKKGESESILALSLAAGIARCKAEA